MISISTGAEFSRVLPLNSDLPFPLVLSVFTGSYEPVFFVFKPDFSLDMVLLDVILSTP